MLRAYLGTKHARAYLLWKKKKKKKQQQQQQHQPRSRSRATPLLQVILVLVMISWLMMSGVVGAVMWASCRCRRCHQGCRSSRSNNSKQLIDDRMRPPGLSGLGPPRAVGINRMSLAGFSSCRVWDLGAGASK